MRTLLALLLLVAVFAGPLAAQSPLTTDAWYDAQAGVRIVFAEEASGEVGAKIVWLRDPIDSTTGGPALDRRNPDAALRTRPIIGLPMIRGMQAKEAGSWSDGTIYDARNGKTYRASLKLAHPDTLRVRGYVKVGFVKVGRTAVWTRVPREDAP